MDVWTHDRFRFPLPPGHRFPIDKYALLRERVVADGIAARGEVHEPEPVAWSRVEAVHERRWIRRLRAGELSVREQRGLGLPVVARARRARPPRHRAARSARRATRCATGSG